MRVYACASFQGRLLLLTNETNTFSDCNQTAYQGASLSLFLSFSRALSFSLSLSPSPSLSLSFIRFVFLVLPLQLFFAIEWVSDLLCTHTKTKRTRRIICVPTIHSTMIFIISIISRSIFFSLYLLLFLFVAMFR